MREEDQSYSNEYSILNSVVCKTEQVESEKDAESCCDTFKTEIKEEDLNDNETIHVCELCDKIFVHKTDFINHQNNDACRNRNKLIKTEIKIEIGTDDSCEGIKTEASEDEYGENPRIMRENDENSSGNCPQIKTELDLIDSSSIGNEDNPQEAELSEGRIAITFNFQ
ncbi:hypothetical protein JTB14_037844 [Gonioctena quinquepunctata]|nr:hypothetical protein JTB14_037844 [Gonioctena quinquepunctata]